jgi:hypothetical protein
MPLVQEVVARGVVMRRAGIVSEPVTDHIRYEHAITPLNLRAGEDVRWLPATLEGSTVRCVQNRARLVRALYERLDRLEATPVTPAVRPGPHRQSRAAPTAARPRRPIPCSCRPPRGFAVVGLLRSPLRPPSTRHQATPRI